MVNHNAPNASARLMPLPSRPTEKDRQASRGQNNLLDGVSLEHGSHWD